MNPYIFDFENSTAVFGLGNLREVEGLWESFM